MEPLGQAPLAERGRRSIRVLPRCAAISTPIDPCSICADPRRDQGPDLRLSEDVGDLWAMERSKIFAGRYPRAGRLACRRSTAYRPDELNIAALVKPRGRQAACREVNHGDQRHRPMAKDHRPLPSPSDCPSSACRSPVSPIGVPGGRAELELAG